MSHPDGQQQSAAGPQRGSCPLCQLREISKKHHHDSLKLISGDAMLQQEMSYVFDLAIYTAPPRRSRAIDRYARSAQLPPSSDEARMLEAMRAARFAILIIGPRHDAAGVIATDLIGIVSR